VGKINKITLAYLTGTSLFYGLLIVVQKIGLKHGLDPLSFSFSRSVIVIIISIVYFFPQWKNLKFIKKHELKDLIILGIISAASIVLLFLGQNVTTAINAGFLVRLTPLFVLPFAYLLLKEKFSRKSILVMCMMLVGVFLLITNGTLIIPHVGDLLIIIVALTVAFQNVFAKKIMHSVPTDVVIFFRVCLSALLIVMFVPLLLGYQSFSALFEGLFYVLLTAILYFLSVICQYKAIKLIGPFITTTFFLSGSLFSALFAYLLLGETLSFVQWVGAVGILLGGYLLVKKEKISQLSRIV